MGNPTHSEGSEALPSLHSSYELSGQGNTLGVAAAGRKANSAHPLQHSAAVQLPYIILRPRPAGGDGISSRRHQLS